jgi:hypothetical protein
LLASGALKLRLTTLTNNSTDRVINFPRRNAHFGIRSPVHNADLSVPALSDGDRSWRQGYAVKPPTKKVISGTSEVAASVNWDQYPTSGTMNEPPPPQLAAFARELIDAIVKIKAVESLKSILDIGEVA